MWKVILKQYWQVSLFRRTPADTPYSLFLLVSIALIYFILILLQWVLADLKKQFTAVDILFVSILLLVSYFVYTWGLLTVFGKSNRLVQTLSSLLAGHAIVHVFALPLLLSMPLISSRNVDHAVALFLGIIYLFLTLVLTIWQFMVSVHIYKHALEVKYFSALLAALGLLAFTVLIVSFW